MALGPGTRPIRHRDDRSDSVAITLPGLLRVADA